VDNNFYSDFDVKMAWMALGARDFGFCKELEIEDRNFYVFTVVLFRTTLRTILRFVRVLWAAPIL